MLRLLKDYNENTMEIISEILDLIVEGTLELIGSKKVPMILRIIAGFVLIGLCSCLFRNDASASSVDSHWSGSVTVYGRYCV